LLEQAASGEQRAASIEHRTWTPCSVLFAHASGLCLMPLLSFGLWLGSFAVVDERSPSATCTAIDDNARADAYLTLLGQEYTRRTI